MKVRPCNSKDGNRSVESHSAHILFPTTTNFSLW